MSEQSFDHGLGPVVGPASTLDSLQQTIQLLARGGDGAQRPDIMRVIMASDMVSFIAGGYALDGYAVEGKPYTRFSLCHMIWEDGDNRTLAFISQPNRDNPSARREACFLRAQNRLGELALPLTDPPKYLPLQPEDSGMLNYYLNATWFNEPDTEYAAGLFARICGVGAQNPSEPSTRQLYDEYHESAIQTVIRSRHVWRGKPTGR